MSGTSNLGLPGLAFAKLLRITAIEHQSSPYRDALYLSGKISGRYTDELSLTPIVRTDFLAIPLRSDAPQLVLKRRGLGFLAAAGIDFASPAQQLLGDPEHHFNAYFAPEHSTAAAQILSPGLVAELVEHASDFDIEFIDRWAFFYASPMASRGSQPADFNPLLNALFARIRAHTAPPSEFSELQLISPDEQLHRFEMAQASRKRLSTRPSRLRTAVLIFSWTLVLSGLSYLLLQNLLPPSP
ncbi:hypothetical protein [Psychromicrobium lacuslunae]|uniref:Uncharacterized protein n=1 Tax=Psychromicrobium lacuslunae TaxID=1618207 RepID=A0A0D4BZX8_9MICC|nr:hypothetical protein [Psychromicrobium lacuslunae]AJT41883.1 hypothetical protein UM93_10810 [Psychromicrobium lacuslunae]